MQSELLQKYATTNSFNSKIGEPMPHVPIENKFLYIQSQDVALSTVALQDSSCLGSVEDSAPTELKGHPCRTPAATVE